MRADGEHDMPILVGKAGEDQDYALVKLGTHDTTEKNGGLGFRDLHGGYSLNQSPSVHGF